MITSEIDIASLEDRYGIDEVSAAMIFEANEDLHLSSMRYGDRNTAVNLRVREGDGWPQKEVPLFGWMKDLESTRDEPSNLILRNVCEAWAYIVYQGKSSKAINNAERTAQREQRRARQRKPDVDSNPERPVIGIEDPRLRRLMKAITNFSTPPSAIPHRPWLDDVTKRRLS